MSKEKAREKIYTYQFSFINDEGADDATSFCAENLAEAISLFREFCNENGYSGKYENVEAVFDTDDADVYGFRYGDPSKAPMDPNAAI